RPPRLQRSDRMSPHIQPLRPPTRRTYAVIALAGEEKDNAAHRKVRARVEHAIGRMKNYKILRDCRQRGDGLHHAVQAVANMHNLALAS
ncbi:transposase family protein, partial [Streptomyces chartreusis]